MNKRTIKPHKGGRTATLHIRLTPASRKSLDALASALGMSAGDIVERHIEHAGVRLAMCKLQRVTPAPEVVLDGKIGIRRDEESD